MPYKPYKLVVILFALIVLGVVAPATSSAYVGPGAGLSLIGSLVGLVLAIFTAVVGVLLWPLRKWLKSKKSNNAIVSKEFAEGKK